LSEGRKGGKLKREGSRKLERVVSILDGKKKKRQECTRAGKGRSDDMVGKSGVERGKKPAERRALAGSRKSSP